MVLTQSLASVGEAVEAAEAAVPVPAAALKQAVARAVETKMPAGKAERGDDEDDQDFAGGALHGAGDRRVGST